jgi:hypothetical protein
MRECGRPDLGRLGSKLKWRDSVSCKQLVAEFAAIDFVVHEPQETIDIVVVEADAG